jgi:Lhr-like helicase
MGLGAGMSGEAQDVFDVPALVSLLRDIGGRKIRIVEVETPTPSPFSRSLDATLLAELLGQTDLLRTVGPLTADEVMHRYARTHGPFTAEAAVTRYALGVAIGHA